MVYYNEHSNIKSMNHSNKFNFLKKFTKFLLPLSVFSFLLSQSSLVPVLVQSYDYLVSNLNFKIKLFTYTTERNCIFLLCNGILVLIIQSSGVISKITPAKSAMPKAARIDDHRGEKDDEVRRFQENEKKGVGKAEILEEKGRENDCDDMVKGGIVAAEVDMDEDYQSRGVEKWDEDDDEGIDTDELNKKFEDFIKKVKQEIHGA